MCSEIRLLKPRRKKKCPICRNYFTPFRDFQQTCKNYDCILENSKKKEKKKKMRAKQDFKQSDKSTQKELAQNVFNTYIRMRDKDLPCISCNHSGQRQRHASHYMSRGKAPQLAFNTNNVHASCSICNNQLSGNLIPYRVALIEKIGIKKVEQLESNCEYKKYDIDYYKRVIRIFRAKIKRLERKYDG